MRVLAITGPTGSGKSALAMALAPKLNAEIVCMDSMQIYRRMDIGTAKPTKQERAAVPHHMLDLVEPTGAYAVADYADAAEKVILEILSRGRTPMLVGGTGLYLQALMRGLGLGGVGSDEALRDRLRSIAQQEGGRERLHARLAQVDPQRAASLNPNDVRRVIRALEVFELTGAPMSQQPPQAVERAFKVLPLTLDMPREILFDRIARRVSRMLDDGLVEEVASLLESGVPAQAQAMQGIGYKEIIPVVQGRETIKNAAWNVEIHTRHYAKRQMTWLRAQPETIWLKATQADLTCQALEAARRFLEGGQA